MLKIIDKEKG
jgi:hypothetical protein